MTQLRHSLLAAILLAGLTPAWAMADDAVISGIPGVTAALLSPDAWVSRLPDADHVLLDRTAVDALNAKVLREDPSMHDLHRLPAALTHDDVAGWVEKISHRPTATLYDEHGTLIPASALDAIMANDAIEAIPASVTPRFGMAVRRTALRSHATEQRVFNRTGDTDIDRFQESTLFPGDAVAVVHTSKDGHWFFVVSNRYAAWVRASDIGTGRREQVLAYADATPYRVITGARPRTVITPEAPALSEVQLDMGTRLPLVSTGADDTPVNGQHPYTSWVLSLPVRSDTGALSFQPALLPRSELSESNYLPLTRANIIRQAFRFLGERYGWGHDFNGRDCSGFVSDVYRSMGVQMPRNTGDQADSPALSHTTYSSKDGHDTRVAAAMATEPGDLIYIPGHVLMVIGKHDGKPWVIHDVGGISLRQPDGSLRRIKLNEVSVTPLLPLMYDKDSTFVDRMTSIVRIR